MAEGMYETSPDDMAAAAGPLPTARVSGLEREREMLWRSSWLPLLLMEGPCSGQRLQVQLRARESEGMCWSVQLGMTGEQMVAVAG